jgi:DNA ligase-1
MCSCINLKGEQNERDIMKSQITKPMLAETCEDVATLQLPVLATPKEDGHRCLKRDGLALTRKFKPVRNRYVREYIEANVPDGCDGELMLKVGSFQKASGDFAREEGQPDFCYDIFDYVAGGLDRPYIDRMTDLAGLALPERCRRLIPVWCRTLDELRAFEEKCLKEGYEGVMVRDPQGPYKCGRSTVNEGWLLKVKRFKDSEAVILRVWEGQHNTNKAEKDELGHTKRSSAKAGKVGNGTLGALTVRDLKSKVEFNIGSGFDGAEAVKLWKVRQSLPGKVVKYKYQPVGVLVAPRFPVFIGFREAWDMD